MYVSSKWCKTIFKKNIIDHNTSTNLYNYLATNIQWEDGIKSIKGYTRKAKPLNIGDIPEVDIVITTALSLLTNVQYVINGIYLNFYQTHTN